MDVGPRVRRRTAKEEKVAGSRWPSGGGEVVVGVEV